MGRFSLVERPVKYAKPHLHYNAQLDLLRRRGLEIADDRAAVRALRRIGYYRLSAYTYVLRRSSPRGTSERPPPPSDEFIGGATFEQAVSLHDFDDRLRGVLLSGLQRIEVAMRVQIGYQLGKTDPHGHLDVSHLDAARCGELAHGSGAGAPRTLHEEWTRRFDALVDGARNEEFVRHFVRKYDGLLPIWAATEVMTFGCLTGLYNLLGSRDAGTIARCLGIKNRDVVHGWLRALNVLRNHCAHNARVWNRATVYPPRIPAPTQTHARLHHLRDADNNRFYVLAAIIGHLLICLDPSTNWPRQLATVVKKFPAVPGLSPESSMGFPDGWQRMELWPYEPG
jgi:abortive infection bacteriophage resistance protein